METVSSGVEYFSCKRGRNELSSDEESLKSRSPKHQKWFYVLGSEDSEEMNTDDQETIYSLQDKTTDTVQDSTDMECVSDDTRMIEFEVPSSSEGDHAQTMPCFVYSSSEPQDILRLTEIITLSGNEDCLADSSSAEGLSDELQANPHRPVPSHLCLSCKKPKSNPYFTQCYQCFKLKKSFLPPRPKRKKNKSSTEAGSSQESFSSDVSSQGKCLVCFNRPRNAGFLHNDVVHVFSCYSCSVRICNETSRCPICKAKVHKVIKVVLC